MSALGSTAEVCAALRTLAGVDPVAARFLRGAKLTTLARLQGLRPVLRLLAGRLVEGALAYEDARTRHLDELVARELGRGVDQLVLLGAGFDTRAHRFPLQTFEVDLPALSRRKRALAAGLPGRVAYVEADLERDDVRARLVAAGFDPKARSLVLWVGVSMYVSPDAVARVLALVAGFAPGTRLVFDYVFEPPPADFVRAVERRGEPLGFATGDAGALLAGAGLVLERDVRPRELARRYLHGGRVPYRFVALAHARVP